MRRPQCGESSISYSLPWILCIVLCGLEGMLELVDDGHGERWDKMVV